MEHSADNGNGDNNADNNNNNADNGNGAKFGTNEADITWINN